MTIFEQVQKRNDTVQAIVSKAFEPSLHENLESRIFEAQRRAKLAQLEQMSDADLDELSTRGSFKEDALRTLLDRCRKDQLPI